MFTIFIAGWERCTDYLRAVIIADHLERNLPSFRFETIGKSFLEWRKYLSLKNNELRWSHKASPLIWKELDGEKRNILYIGETSSFLEYCNVYYNFEYFLTRETFPNILAICEQYKLRQQKQLQYDMKEVLGESNHLTVVVTGEYDVLMEFMIDALRNLSSKLEVMFKVYIYNEDSCKDYGICACESVQWIKVKKLERMNDALIEADLLIILDHVPFEQNVTIKKWLKQNVNKMFKLGKLINYSSNDKLKIIFPNVGPSCFNATVISTLLRFVPKQNIAIASTDLSSKLIKIAARFANISPKNMFEPGVWGFLGINHLIDFDNTYYVHNNLFPYKRYMKVKETTLKIGELKTEIRKLVCLESCDELWKTVVASTTQQKTESKCFYKSEAVAILTNYWFFNRNPENILSVGVYCDGSFGLTMDGYFSQPCHLGTDGNWIPATKYPTPKDKLVNIELFEKVALYLLQEQKCNGGESFCADPLLCTCMASAEKLLLESGEGCFCEMDRRNKNSEERFCFCGWKSVCDCGKDNEVELPKPGPVLVESPKAPSVIINPTQSHSVTIKEPKPYCDPSSCRGEEFSDCRCPKCFCETEPAFECVCGN